jgi:hypothetical protein
MEVHHPHHPTHKKKWSEYIIEFVMLFTAVTLGFFAENIREHIAEENKTKELLHVVAKDLRSDLDQMKMLKQMEAEKIVLADSLKTILNSNPKNVDQSDYYRIIMNFASFYVLNPNDKSNASLVVNDGNLSYSGTGGWWCVRSSIGMTTGKWYCEVKITGGGSPYNTIIGLMTSQSNLFAAGDSYPGLDAYGWGYYGSNGAIYNNNSHVSYGHSFGNGDTIGIAFDAGAGSLTFYYDGTNYFWTLSTSFT